MHPQGKKCTNAASQSYLTISVHLAATHAKKYSVSSEAILGHHLSRAKNLLMPPTRSTPPAPTEAVLTDGWPRRFSRLFQMSVGGLRGKKPSAPSRHLSAGPDRPDYSHTTTRPISYMVQPPPSLFRFYLLTADDYPSSS